ncbi:MAG: T9SS C-terminal target domain-containing protein, partial [Bacteroidetes bacterium]
VAPGVAITSSVSSGANNYAAEDGTSMAGPAAASALFLVQQHYKNLNNGSFMRAATLRGLAIHTAEEAGTTPGPDYGFGWGLLNVEKCVQVVSNTSQTHLLTQESLNNGATFTRQITVAGGQPLKVTICWADLGATPLAETAANINNRTSRLVNDLDLRILDANSNVITDLPWKLNPNTPAAAATKGDNLVDNIERIDVTSLAAGTYTIRVTHKGTLANAQAFSLIVTGIVAPSVAPTITSFTPSSGAVGTNVTITGTNFTGASVVSFNNVNATTFNVVSATSITATVPTSATTGKVRITTANGTAVSTNDFTVTTPTPAPTITSFTPAIGVVGTNVTITGTDFTGASVVSFNNVNATSFNVVSATSITATVPTGTTTGKVRVTTANGTAVSTNDFVIDPNSLESLKVQGISVYPNPTTEIINVIALKGKVGTKVILYDLQGRIIKSQSFRESNEGVETSFNVKELSDGQYLIQIEGIKEVVRVIKK